MLKRRAEDLLYQDASSRWHADAFASDSIDVRHGMFSYDLCVPVVVHFHVALNGDAALSRSASVVDSAMFLATEADFAGGSHAEA